MKKLPIEALEDIRRRAENTHTSGSEYEKATIELDIRKGQLERSAYSEHRKFFEDVNQNLSAIVRYLADKPWRSVILAALGAITIGVAVDVLSTLIEKILHI